MNIDEIVEAVENCRQYRKVLVDLIFFRLLQIKITEFGFKLIGLADTRYPDNPDHYFLSDDMGMEILKDLRERYDYEVKDITPI